MAKTSPGEFIRQVRQEGSKVTMPSRKETAMTTGMVFVMVTLVALFFLVVDQGIQLVIKQIFALGG